MNPKIPATRYDVSTWITQRWSARSFQKGSISDDQMNRLFEAASWSASSMNEQPWRFIYAKRGTTAFDRMISVLMDGNQPWAKDASVMVMSLAKRHFDRTGSENRHAMHDLGAANSTLLLQAAEDGILGHMMGGFHMNQALEAFSIDNTQWEIGCFIALGYPGEADDLDEPFASLERSKRTRHDIETFTELITE